MTYNVFAGTLSLTQSINCRTAYQQSNTLSAGQLSSSLA